MWSLVPETTQRPRCWWTTSTDFLNDILLNLQSFPKSSTLRMLFWNQRLTALLWTASQSQRIWTLLKTIQSESSVRLSTHWCMVWFWREIHRGWQSARGVMLRTIHGKFFKELPIISSHLRYQCYLWIEFVVGNGLVLKVFRRALRFSSIQESRETMRKSWIYWQHTFTWSMISLFVGDNFWNDFFLKPFWKLIPVLP